jgi:type III secretion protein Q
MNNPLPTSGKILRFLQLSRNEAQARTLLAQRVQDCEVTIADQTWHVTLAPLSQAMSLPTEPEDEVQWNIRGQWAGAPFALQIPLSACELWLRARFTELDLPSLPQALHSLALENALDQVLTALKAMNQGAARIDTVSQEPEAPTGLSHFFSLGLTIEDTVIHGVLATNSLGVMLMAGLVSRKAAVEGRVDTNALPMLLRAEVGRTSLKADTVGSLRVGDAVLFDHCWIGQNEEIWLGKDTWGLNARWEDTQLVVTRTFTQMDITMETDSLDTSESATNIDMNQLPIRLGFDLGERSISLGELRALQVGQTLEMSRPLSQAVSIRANGALIGTGELMDIDGRMGVMITSLTQSGAQVV